MEFRELFIYSIAGMLVVMGAFAVGDWFFSSCVSKKDKRILCGGRIMVLNEKTGDYEPVKFN